MLFSEIFYINKLVILQFCSESYLNAKCNNLMWSQFSSLMLLALIFTAPFADGVPVLKTCIYLPNLAGS